MNKTYRTQSNVGKVNMEIIYHCHVDGELQRSLVKHERVTYRRIARWVNPDGTLTAPTVDSPISVWQEKLHFGEFHNVHPDRVEELEKNFITAVILDNR